MGLLEVLQLPRGLGRVPGEVAGQPPGVGVRVEILQAHAMGTEEREHLEEFLAIQLVLQAQLLQASNDLLLLDLVIVVDIDALEPSCQHVPVLVQQRDLELADIKPNLGVHLQDGDHAVAVGVELFPEPLDVASVAHGPACLTKVAEAQPAAPRLVKGTPAGQYGAKPALQELPEALHAFRAEVPRVVFIPLLLAVHLGSLRHGPAPMHHLRGLGLPRNDRRDAGRQARAQTAAGAPQIGSARRGVQRRASALRHGRQELR
mmetsp:Transcript_90726/g.292862  ORF Transcript_90726/g.292862 Transcript_90726/m.292862 type:complete len:261 (-) Transcript_90726:292-1074(-)